MANLEIEIGAKLDALEKALRGASTKLEGFSKQAIKTGKTLSVAITAPLTAAAGFSVKAFADIDKGLREVNSLFGETGEAAEKNFGELKNLAGEVSREIGILQSDVVPGLYNAISAGVPKDNALDFIKTAGKAAIAGVTDLNTSVDGLTTVINAFGKDFSEVGEVADSIFAAIQGGKTTFEELSKSLFNVAPAAAASGVAMGEINAAIATLTASGTPTSVATTQIRAALVGLQRPSEELDKIFQKLGFQNAELAIKSEGLGFALKAVRDASGGSAGQLQKLLGSVEAVAAANVLAGTGAEKFNQELERQANAAGAANVAFGEIDKSFSRSFERLQVSISNIGISIGDILAPAVSKLAALIQKAVNFFDGLSKTSKTVIVVFGAIAAAIGPVLLAVGGLISILPALAAGLAAVKVALIALTGPVGIAVGLFVALGLGIRSLVKDVKLSEQTIKLQSTALDGFANANKLALEAQALVNKSLAENGKVSKEASLQTRELIKSKIEDVRASLLQAKAANDVAVAEARKITFLDKLETVFLPGLASQQRRVNEVQKQGAKEIESINKLLNELTVSLLKPIEPLIELAEKVETTFEQFSKLADIANEKVFAKFAADAAEFNKELDETIELQKRLAAITGGDAFDKDLAARKKKQGEVIIQDIKIDDTGAPIVEFAEIDESKKTAFLQSLKSFATEVDDIIQNTIVNSISDLGFSIGQALSEGANVFSAIGESLLNSLGSFLGELGQKLIAYGVAGLAFSTATKGLLNPITAGPSALGLIAAGTALTLASGAISGILKGGAGGGGGTSGVGQSFSGSGVNTAFVDSFGALDIQGTSTIKGQDIIIAFDKANRTNGR
jgi:TP901 family phage tail tape measure protein